MSAAGRNRPVRDFCRRKVDAVGLVKRGLAEPQRMTLCLRLADDSHRWPRQREEVVRERQHEVVRVAAFQQRQQHHLQRLISIPSRRTFRDDIQSGAASPRFLIWLRAGHDVSRPRNVCAVQPAQRGVPGLLRQPVRAEGFRDSLRAVIESPLVRRNHSVAFRRFVAGLYGPGQPERVRIFRDALRSGFRPLLPPLQQSAVFEPGGHAWAVPVVRAWVHDGRSCANVPARVGERQFAVIKLIRREHDGAARQRARVNGPRAQFGEPLSPEQFVLRMVRLLAGLIRGGRGSEVRRLVDQIRAIVRTRLAAGHLARDEHARQCGLTQRREIRPLKISLVTVRDVRILQAADESARQHVRVDGPRQIQFDGQRTSARRLQNRLRIIGVRLVFAGDVDVRCITALLRQQPVSLLGVVLFLHGTLALMLRRNPAARQKTGTIQRGLRVGFRLGAASEKARPDPHLECGVHVARFRRVPQILQSLVVTLVGRPVEIGRVSAAQLLIHRLPSGFVVLALGYHRSGTQRHGIVAVNVRHARDDHGPVREEAVKLRRGQVVSDGICFVLRARRGGRRVCGRDDSRAQDAQQVTPDLRPRLELLPVQVVQRDRDQVELERLPCVRTVLTARSADGPGQCLLVARCWIDVRKWPLGRPIDQRRLVEYRRGAAGRRLLRVADQTRQFESGVDGSQPVRVLLTDRGLMHSRSHILKLSARLSVENLVTGVLGVAHDPHFTVPPSAHDACFSSRLGDVVSHALRNYQRLPDFRSE